MRGQDTGLRARRHLGPNSVLRLRGAAGRSHDTPQDPVFSLPDGGGVGRGGTRSAPSAVAARQDPRVPGLPTLCPAGGRAALERIPPFVRGHLLQRGGGWAPEMTVPTQRPLSGWEEEITGRPPSGRGDPGGFPGTPAYDGCPHSDRSEGILRECYLAAHHSSGALTGQPKEGKGVHPLELPPLGPPGPGSTFPLWTLPLEQPTRPTRGRLFSPGRRREREGWAGLRKSQKAS